ncbi:MAG: thioredoxin-like domain-containing protein [Ignavibacteriales bacterium]|nr:thioredoxin-like domain-containing protein [Ignavibacteriales bacterium]
MKRIFLNIFCLLIILSSTQAADDSDKTVIYGKLLGYNDKPIQTAHVTLLPENITSMILTGIKLDPVKVESDGSFKIITDRKGMLSLSFIGDKHEGQSVLIFVEKPSKVKLDVRLVLYQWSDNVNELKLVGDFNKFSWNSDFILMKKNEDGTFSADININEDRKLKYGIIGYIKGSGALLTGTEQDETEIRGMANYATVVDVKKGIKTIVFDPAKLPHENSDPYIKFENPQSYTAKIALLSDEFNKALINSYKSKPNNYDWNPIVAQIKKSLGTEKNKYVRQMLFISYINLISTNYKVEPALIKKALTELSPDYELFSMRCSSNLYEAVVMNGGYAENKKYVEDILAKNPSKEFQSFFLNSAYDIELKNKNTILADEFYNRLQNNYPDFYAAKLAKSNKPPEKIVAGKPMIEFEFTCIDSSRKVYTNNDFKGKNYLIDFWAVWCVPCCAELPNVHQVYEKYKNRNFEILSVSLDAAPKDVEKYRKIKWAMPWHHAFLGQENFKVGSEVGNYFELHSIPKPVLVNSEGIIIAVGNELLGEGLEKHLVELLK